MPQDRLEFTSDDLLACLENAEALRKDALRSSPETELVLLTFSIEEAAKGFVIAFEHMLAVDGVDPSSAESLSQVTDPGLRAILSRHKDLLTPESVRKAFWKHEAKIAHLTFVADYCLYLVPRTFPLGIRLMIFAPGVPLGLRIRAFFWHIDHRDGQLKEGDKLALAGLDSVDFAAFESLRQRALYVGLARSSGGTLAPVADDNVLDWLEEVAEILIDLLDGMWIAISSGWLKKRAVGT